MQPQCAAKPEYVKVLTKAKHMARTAASTPIRPRHVVGNHSRDMLELCATKHSAKRSSTETTSVAARTHSRCKQPWLPFSVPKTGARQQLQKVPMGISRRGSLCSTRTGPNPGVCTISCLTSTPHRGERPTGSRLRKAGRRRSDGNRGRRNGRSPSLVLASVAVVPRRSVASTEMLLRRELSHAAWSACTFTFDGEAGGDSACKESIICMARTGDLVQSVGVVACWHAFVLFREEESEAAAFSLSASACISCGSAARATLGDGKCRDTRYSYCCIATGSSSAAGLMRWRRAAGSRATLPLVAAHSKMIVARSDPTHGSDAPQSLCDDGRFLRDRFLAQGGKPCAT